MSTRTTNPQYKSRDRTSERAARGAMAQFRAAAAKSAPPAAPDPANAVINGRRDSQRSVADPQILRRWVLADLIAAASRRRTFA
jgi:hypothetical protein